MLKTDNLPSGYPFVGSVYRIYPDINSGYQYVFVTDLMILLSGTEVKSNHKFIMGTGG